jgi:hypothetical protein
VQALTPPEPLPPQLWKRRFDRGAGHEAHVVELDVTARCTATQHRQKQGGQAKSTGQVTLKQRQHIQGKRIARGKGD